MENNSDVEIYISEIAERLWSGHASLMVGAGFSMNAQRSNMPIKKFPSWNDLGDIFYQKLYGKIPTEKDKCYLDALKLAEEVEASFGRSALNKILREEIPNTEYQPSQLHTKLLQLPWTDIFTTNYDTLLERTAEKVLEQRYETVINKEDLVWSTKPRIIKLHGSFPSERPFIITEEDYRRYPTEYAPFVNTVQQSLLENTLCLIGFSGNDPNFQKWIGWIRDNLGKDNSPKIFLIGKLSLSIGQKKLLQDRNIVPIDLSCYSNNHYEALIKFVGILKSKGRSTETNIDFPDKEKSVHFDIKKELNPQFQTATKVWKNTRLSYPNWLILPEDNREKLYYKLETPFIYHINKIEAPLDIEFLHEFNWRIEKCLFPIVNDWLIFYENVISKYNPFPDFLHIENANITPKTNENLEWKLITNYWLELQLSLLRYYREENFQEKWILLAEFIEKIKNEISPELVARYSYERCLHYLFQLDISSVRKELNNWEINESLPYWEAKRAGLLAELGDLEIAEKILETSLTEIRNRLRFSPVKDDYTLVSQEAYVLQLSRYVRSSANLSKGIFSNHKNDDYSERWNELIKYKCDPWNELKSFEASLKTENYSIKTIEKKYNFGIGSITNTHRLSKGSTYATVSYAFLRYIEETGIPLKLPNTTFGKDAAKKAISCISNYSPNWGFVSLIRTGDHTITDDIFNRRALSFLDREKCDELTTNYLDVLVKSSSEIKKGNTYRKENFAISLSTIIPHILSRLCVKCSYDTKIKILDFLKNLYLSDVETRKKYGKIDKLVQFLIKSFSAKERYGLIPMLLDFPIIADPDTRDPFPDLIQFLGFRDLQQTNKIKVNLIKIEETISLLSDDNFKRKVAITRLITLWQNNLLNKTQENKFAKALWKKLDKNGFPKDAAYYYFAFISFPHPKNINPEELLRIYFENTHFPIEEKKEKGSGISITNGDFFIFHNIIGTTNTDINYQWNRKEINKLLSNCIEWWNTDKKYLRQTEDRFMGSIADEFKARFKNMIRIFSEVIVLNTHLIDSSLLPKIESLLNELSEYGMPALEAKVSFLKLFPTTKQIIYDEIQLQLYSKNEERILDSVNSISILANIGNEDIKVLVKNVSENIKSRTEIALDRFLESMNVILKYNYNLFTMDILNDLEIGFEFLFKEVYIQHDDTEEIVHKKLLIQKYASILIVSLKKYYSDIIKVSLPEYISKWENTCLDVNEFSEIRNIWLNSKE
jgi:hypothetical protein